MAPKRSKEDPLEHPPPASDHSSSDEECSEDEEESSSGTPPPPPQPKPAVQKQQSSSSDDSGSGSDTDSDAEPTPLPSSKVVEPLASKPLEKAPAKAPRSKPPSTPAAMKRPSETESEKESKRSRKRTKSEGTAEKRARVWSEDDGIAVLKGMIEFQEKNGSTPNSDMNGFHDFIKKSLRADVSKTQLSDKIRHMKSKYMATLEKMKKDESGSSLKPHEKEVFNLSNKIWGVSNGIHTVKAAEQQRKSPSKKAKKLKSLDSSVPIPSKPETPASVDVAKESEAMEIDQNSAPPKGSVENLVSDMMQVTGNNIQEYVMKKGLDFIEGSKRAELEERWAELHKAELALFVQRTELLYEQAMLLLEARK